MQVFSSGVGSLPYESAELAAAQACQSYALPFLPQLPRHPGWTLASDWAGPKQHPVWDEFAQRVQGKARAKAQIVGPCTAAQLTGLSALTQTIERATLAYADELRALVVGDAFLFWDEPVLPAHDDAHYWDVLQSVQEKLASRGVRMGFHSCASFRAPAIERLPLDVVLSFDAHAVTLDAATLRRRAQSAGAIAIGCIDTRSETLDEEAATAKLQELAASLMGVGAETAVILTGGCGTGLRSIGFEERLAASLGRLAAAGLF